MQITNVKIRKMFNDDGPMKAVVSVTFDDCFAVHDLKVVELKTGRRFVVMPSIKLEDGNYRDVAHPIGRDFRTELTDAVLEAYDIQKAVDLGN